MDYTHILLEAQLESSRLFNEEIFNVMEQESDFMQASLESMIVVTEALDNAKAKVKDFFQAIIDFINKIVTTFIANVKKLFGNQKQWMADNFPKLQDLNYVGLEVSMVPLWLVDVNKMQSTARQILQKVSSVSMDKNAADKNKTMDDVKKNIFNDYLDENGDLAGGLKNFYRVGKSQGPLKAVVLKDNDLGQKINSIFKTYCNNYQSQMVSFINQISTQTKNQLNMINNSLKRAQLKESYSLLEETDFANTELAYCKDFALLEADTTQNNTQNNNQQTQQGNTNTNNNANKSASATKVETTDLGNKSNSEQQTQYDSQSSAQLILAKNIASVAQLSVTALMTVSEEKFNAYLAAIRQVIAARGKKAPSTKEVPENKK